MDIDMGVATTATSTAMSVAASTTAGSAATTAMSMSMEGSSGCKLSMLLNWNTIDACFLFPKFHIRSSFIFFLTCLGSFLLVIALELLRRFQREFDNHLRATRAIRQDKEYVLLEEMEEQLLDKGSGEVSPGARKERPVVIVLEQIMRGLVHMVQFSISYCIMLLFM